MTILQDKQLEKEFKRTVANLKNTYPNFDINSLPTPFDIPTVKEIVQLKGIEDNKLKVLEGSYVELITSKDAVRHSYNQDGTLRKKIKYTVKSNNCIILIDKDLNIRKSSDIQTKGYSFIDKRYIKDEKGLRKQVFAYEVPKSICFKVNLCYLIVSSNKRSKHLGGEKLILKNGHTVYIYVIPTRNTKLTDGYRVLAIKTGNDFKNEIALIKRFWKQNNIMFNNKDNFKVDSLTKGEYNLVSEIYETNEEVEKVSSVSLAKGDEEYDIL